MQDKQTDAHLDKQQTRREGAAAGGDEERPHWLPFGVRHPEIGEGQASH